MTALSEILARQAIAKSSLTDFVVRNSGGVAMVVSVPEPFPSRSYPQQLELRGNLRSDQELLGYSDIGIHIPYTSCYAYELWSE